MCEGVRSQGATEEEAIGRCRYRIHPVLQMAIREPDPQGKPCKYIKAVLAMVKCGMSDSPTLYQFPYLRPTGFLRYGHSKRENAVGNLVALSIDSAGRLT